MTHRAESTTARSPAIEGLAVTVPVVSAMVWWLSGSGAAGPVVARVIADGAAVCVLGLAVMPYLSGEPLPMVLRGRAWSWLALVTPIWLMAETGRLLVMAGQAAGVAVGRTSPSTWWLYVTATDAGLANLVAVVAAAGSLILLVHRHIGGVVVCLAALGLVSRAWAGHASATSSGVIIVAVHVMAAGLWCGGLAALAMTVRHRDEWALMLPGYSRMALVSVLVLSASGAIGAVLVLPSWSAQWTTGYGRVLSVKLALTVLLVVIGWRQRRSWLPAVRMTSAALSHRRAAIEIAVMAVALVSAAVLAMTG